MSSSPRRHSPYPARIPEFLEHWSRRTFVRVTVGAALTTLVLGLWNAWFWWLALPVAAFAWGRWRHDVVALAALLATVQSQGRGLFLVADEIHHEGE